MFFFPKTLLVFPNTAFDIICHAFNIHIDYSSSTPNAQSYAPLLLLYSVQQLPSTSHTHHQTLGFSIPRKCDPIILILNVPHSNYHILFFQLTSSSALTSIIFHFFSLWDLKYIDFFHLSSFSSCPHSCLPRLNTGVSHNHHFLYMFDFLGLLSFPHTHLNPG